MEEKIITQKISILPENEKEEKIPLPDQKEKEVFYSPTSI